MVPEGKLQCTGPILNLLNMVRTFKPHVCMIHFGVTLPSKSHVFQSPSSFGGLRKILYTHFSFLVSHFPLSNHHNILEQRIRISKLVIILFFFPSSYSLISLWSKYSSQHFLDEMLRRHLTSKRK
jgi:hypothetical protein